MSSVHVTWWRPEADDLPRMRAFFHWLSAGERARHDRFLTAASREAFLASRILLRHTLAVATGQPPPAVRFSTETFGEKPHLVVPDAAGAWHFSLTHTEGLVACAVTTMGDVGIDAERLARETRVDVLARRVLSPAEQAALAALPGEARPRRFLEYWCVKEAWLKAEGIGLRRSPAGVEVTFDERIRVAPARHDVQLVSLHPAYVVALAHPALPAGADAVDVRPFAWHALVP